MNRHQLNKATTNKNSSENRRSGKRNSKGSSLLEIPVSLWMVFVVFFVPMLALGSITLRATLLSLSVHDAIQAAAKARTFNQSSADGKSAKQIASEVFRAHLQLFPVIASSEIDLDILQTNFTNQQITRSEDTLTSSADTSRNVYQIEGTAIASIDPLIPFNSSIFGSIQGLTEPLNVSFSSRQMFENAQGLNR
ncbi:MAG: hypothetical protein K2X77_00665 [Candidatus Obscuribacterales bacterium]|jgi:hypothetical protein|nr:hypothetical protein [Candidatus Obscuribacterales bacterium]